MKKRREKRPETCSYKAFCLTIVAMSNVYRIRFEAARGNGSQARPSTRRGRGEEKERNCGAYTVCVFIPKAQKEKPEREREKKAFNRLELFSGFDYFVVFCRFRENSSPRRIARFIVLKGEATNL